MLDDFDGLDSASFLDDLEEEISSDKDPVSRKSVRRSRAKSSGPERLVLGMTAMQRFIISVMLFSMVCVMGFFFLMIIDSVSLF